MDGPTPAAAILAGGQARRFGGRDKSRLIIEGRPIIVRQVEVLQRVSPEVFIVGPTDSRFSDLALPVHADRTPPSGAIGGLWTALEVAVRDPVIIVACDLPFLDAGLLGCLVDLTRDADAAWVRTARGAHPLLACYRRDARGAIARELGAGRRRLADLDRVLRIAELDEPAVARFGDVERLLANVNTPDDCTRLQSGP